MRFRKIIISPVVTEVLGRTHQHRLLSAALICQTVYIYCHLDKHRVSGIEHMRNTQRVRLRVVQHKAASVYVVVGVLNRKGSRK